MVFEVLAVNRCFAGTGLGKTCLVQDLIKPADSDKSIALR